jgi:hypothetical protein
MPDPSTGNYTLTLHAARVAAERRIEIAWIGHVLENPDLVEIDPNDATLERRYGAIDEQGGRVLRVVVNTTVEPLRVVSVFFDRRKRGKL